MMGLIFGLFIVGVLLLLGVPWPLNIYIALILTIFFVLIQIAVSNAVVRWSKESLVKLTFRLTDS